MKEIKGELKSILKLGLKQKIDYPWARIDDYTSKYLLKTIFINNGEESCLTWYKSNDFSRIQNVKQCYGLCFNNKGKLLIINTTGNWCLPGGTPEKGETFEQTLIREVDEEADVEIKDIQPLGYNKIEKINGGKKSVFYQLRFIARISKIKKRTPDPAYNKIPKRIFINLKDFLKYCPWGRPGEQMINDSIKNEKFKGKIK